jgi:TetR/AcrR family transcriptional regulator
LLDAARELLGESSPGDLSVREITRRAGVSSAMVSYHFGGKEGLFAALLEREITGVVGRLEGAVPQASSENRLRIVLEEMTSSIGQSPWLPGLLVRMVLLEPGAPRERFLTHLGPRIARLLQGVITEGIESGRLRPDLDPHLALLSFLGVTVYPFIARPVVERLLRISYDDDFRRGFVEHTERLLIQGIGGLPNGRS